MLTAYLAVNAVLYALFSAWCALMPQQTSTFLGLARTNPGGESEYLAVYGGLQAGLAVFYAVASFTPGYRQAALVFSLALYGGIVLLRTIAVLRLGFSEIGNARYAYVLEIILLLAAILLMVRPAR